MNDANDETKSDLPKRLQGPQVFERVQRETLKLRHLVDGLRGRRRKDAEDDLTKDVFDALDDLDTILAEAHGLLDVLEARVRAKPHATQEAIRAEKQATQIARQRRDDPGPPRHRLLSPFGSRPSSRTAVQAEHVGNKGRDL